MVQVTFSEWAEKRPPDHRFFDKMQRDLCVMDLSETNIFLDYNMEDKNLCLHRVLCIDSYYPTQTDTII